MESIAQYKRDETWAPTEKKLARIAFDKAFERQCTAITQEARRMLETATAPSDIFRVQEYLTEQKRIVDGLYDYRYSRLLEVLGRLLSDGWLKEGDLHGLPPEKIAKIKHQASFFAESNVVLPANLLCVCVEHHPNTEGEEDLTRYVKTVID